jgi:2-polyprenyl-3-methyl-5-hydroxy-6-metoxy-1,4-benzoquinol methylase
MRSFNMIEDREQIFRDYYKLDDWYFYKIKELSTSPREAYFTEDFTNALKYYGVNAIIMRTMLRYTRYRKSQTIVDFFDNNHIDMRDMKVLDFGCGVGDYGITLARRGATVTFCDFPEIIDFVKFRCLQESIKVHFIESAGTEDEQVSPDYTALALGKFDLAIFGEVLEHIPAPLQLLQTLQGVRYIFTSSFPFKREVSFHEPGHSLSAFAEQKQCLQFLEANYTCNTLLSVLKMWCANETL